MASEIEQNRELGTFAVARAVVRPFSRTPITNSVISKDVLRQRTSDYHRWMDAFTRKQRIPIEWAQKGVRKQDYPAATFTVRSTRIVSASIILKSMEVGPSFRSTVPRYPVDDPNYRILARQRSRYTQ